MRLDRALKNGLPNLVFDNSDISDLVKIVEMFEGTFLCRKCGTTYENKAWEKLKKYLECERMKLESQMKLSVALNRIDETQTRVEVAKLVGFDHFVGLEDKIRLKLEKLQEKPEEEYDANDTDAR